MKKVLFATTALVASAGFAAAQEVTLSGTAEMGVIGGSDDFDLQFHTDIDVTFTMAGQTDTGLTFGANIDLDEVDDDEGDDGPDFEDPTQQGGESIFVSGAFGTLTMGDTDGALDWALQEAIIGSALNDDHEHAGYTTLTDGNAGLDGRYDGQIARYEYAFADFAVAVSGEIDDGGDGDPILGLGVRYATEFAGNDIALGLGVQTISSLEELGDDVLDEFDDIIDDVDDIDDIDNLTIWGVSADIQTVMGFQVILNYSHYDDAGEHWGAAVGYTLDAWTFAANYGHVDLGLTDEDAEGYGLVVNYDLGGGAELQAGYGHNNVGANDFDTYSFGIAMAF